MAKDQAVCIGVTSDLAFAAGVTMLNYSKFHDTVGTTFHIFSDSRLTHTKRALQRAGLDVRITKFRPPVPWLSLWSARSIGFFSPLVLSKFEIFNLLAEFRSVLWLDYDILIQKPLNDLEISGKYDAAYMLSGHSANAAFSDKPVSEALPELGMSAGLIKMSDSFPSHNRAAAQLYAAFTQYAKILYFPEQGCFDLYLHGTNFRYKELQGSEYSCFPDTAESKNAVILHSFGSKKFWNGVDDENWNALYREWLALGGPKYSKIANTLKKIKRKFYYLFASGIMFLLLRTQKMNKS